MPCVVSSRLSASTIVGFGEAHVVREGVKMISLGIFIGQPGDSGEGRVGGRRALCDQLIPFRLIHFQAVFQEDDKLQSGGFRRACT